jgi:hypothetical protein
MTFCSKLERLSLASLFSLVKCLRGRPRAYPRAEHLKGASLRNSPSIRQSVCLSVRPSVRPSVRRSVHLSVGLSVHLYIHPAVVCSWELFQLYPKTFLHALLLQKILKQFYFHFMLTHLDLMDHFYARMTKGTNLMVSVLLNSSRLYIIPYHGKFECLPLSVTSICRKGWSAYPSGVNLKAQQHSMLLCA